MTIYGLSNADTQQSSAFAIDIFRVEPLIDSLDRYECDSYGLEQLVLFDLDDNCLLYILAN